MMTYIGWLLVWSAVFVVLERVWPRDRRQGVFRRGWLTDAAYLVLNGHFLGAWLASASRPLVEVTQTWLSTWVTSVGGHLSIAGAWPWWVQFAVALVAIDFLQWCIHNLLHRVPWLWEVHKVHHSIQDMDWAGSLRFHWAEIVVYKTLQFLPLVWFGFDGSVLFALAVVGTAIGHFNHSNLRWKIGPLRYVLNNPQMHVWHHVHPDAGPINKNFGINLSVWDYLFGTAYVPEQPPERLGFDDIESFPKTLPGQVLYPLPVERWVRGRLPAERAGSETTL